MAAFPSFRRRVLALATSPECWLRNNTVVATRLIWQSLTHLRHSHTPPEVITLATDLLRYLCVCGFTAREPSGDVAVRCRPGPNSPQGHSVRATTYDLQVRFRGPVETRARSRDRRRDSLSSFGWYEGKRSTPAVNWRAQRRARVPTHASRREGARRGDALLGARSISPSPDAWRRRFRESDRACRQDHSCGFGSRVAED